MTQQLQKRQFWTNPGLARCPFNSFIFEADFEKRSRTGERPATPAGAIDTAMETCHEWLAMRECLWLNDKNAVIGLTRLNPLTKISAVKKSLTKWPAKAKKMLGVAGATPKPLKAMLRLRQGADRHNRIKTCGP